MLDDSLHEQLADWVRPVTRLAVPDIRVLRRRARRRGMRRAAATVTMTVVVTAVAVGVMASLLGAGRPAGGRPASGSPPWPAGPGTWTHGVWRPAGPLPAADASPVVAPYIVLLVPGRGTVQVRNVYTFKTIATVQPPRGQFFAGIAAAGDDRTFVLQAEVGGRTQQSPMPVNPTAAAFDELRLTPDGRPESLGLLGTVPARDGLSGFAISQDASMLAYSTGSGFETVSLATGRGRSWPAVDAGNVAPLSLSWAGDRTLAFEWGTATTLIRRESASGCSMSPRRARCSRRPGWSSGTAGTARRPTERARMAS